MKNIMQKTTNRWFSASFQKWIGIFCALSLITFTACGNPSQGGGEVAPPDFDEDGTIDSEDNCERDYNPDQIDLDNDGEGDVCDSDIDGDGIANNNPDNCERDYNPDQIDLDTDGEGDVCDKDIDGDLVENDVDVDDDGDGLIEVDSDTLKYVTYDPTGASYQETPNGQGSDEGCGAQITNINVCDGYELRIPGSPFDGSTSALSCSSCLTPLPPTTTTIVLSDEWIPIGLNTGTGLVTPFTGRFDGNNYTIEGLRITQITSDLIGFFAELGAGARIQNLNLDEGQNGAISGSGTLGALAGRTTATSTVSNVSSNLTVTGGDGDDDKVGGLVGENAGTIEDSYVTNGVNGGDGDDDDVGGLVGRNLAGGIIQDSYVKYPLVGDYVTACGNGARCTVGGLVGNNNLGAIIQDSYATGTVTGGNGDFGSVGGLVGSNSGTNGTNTDSNITSSYATGNVNGGTGSERNVGGLVGSNNLIIQDSYATGAVNGTNGADDEVGGLIGINNGFIRNSYATGDVNGGDGADDKVGGLVGNNVTGISGQNADIRNSYATGNVLGGNGASDDVGGLIGVNNGPIRNSYATGNVLGGNGARDNVGGLIGNNVTDADIQNSYYAVEDVNGDINGGDGNNDNVGGLVGNHGTGASIQNSYVLHGGVNGGDDNDDNVGGLVGVSTGSIQSSYYLAGNIDGENPNYIGVGLSESQLQTFVFVEGNNTLTNNTLTISDQDGCTDAGGAWDTVSTSCYYSIVNAADCAAALSNAGTLSGTFNAAGQCNLDNQTTESLCLTNIDRATWVVTPGGTNGTCTLNTVTRTSISVYDSWNVPDTNWDFGTSSEFPALYLYELDANGVRVTPANLLCNQPSPRASCP